MAIILVVINWYYISGYWWLFHYKPLVVIDGYFINCYYWLSYYKLLLVIIYYIITIGDCCTINYYWIFYVIIS
jgi:hypothetical protein